MTDILRYRMAGDDIPRTHGAMAREDGKEDAMLNSSKEYIHSGHFMVSDPHKSKRKDDAIDGFNFATASKEPRISYSFTTEEIDSSFAKLFECMNLAYTGCSIVSPKWKNFKGMKLTLRDKIRLNNAIWREWHNQFILRRPPFLCHFSLPLLDNDYGKPQAVVLDGKYAKRTTNAVVSEYQKWRTFFLKRQKALASKHQGLHQSMKPDSPPLFPMILDEEMLMSEFSDTLFSSLNQSFMFPNPREFSHSGVVVDAIQPGLVGLQPPLEELMDTLDTMQDIRSAQLANESNPFIFTAGNPSAYQIVNSQDPQLGIQNINAVQLQQQQLPSQIVAQPNVGQMIIPESLGVTQQTQQLPEMIIVDQAITAQSNQQPNVQQHLLQQDAAPGLTFTVNPQLLNRLLQMQQQQQQPKLQIDQKDPSLTSFGLNTNFESAFSNNLTSALNSNINSNLQTLDILQANNLQSSGNSLMAVPVRLTRAVDTFENTAQPTQNLGLANSMQIQNSQNQTLIASSLPQSQQISTDVTMVEAQAPNSVQQQLLQPLQQNHRRLQRSVQSPLQAQTVKQQVEPTNFFQNITLGSPQTSLAGVTVSPQQEQMQADIISQLNSSTQCNSQQTQALELLKKVASHVSQTGKNALLSNESKEMFQRIFGEKNNIIQHPQQKILGRTVQKKQQPTKTQPQSQLSCLQMEAIKQTRLEEQLAQSNNIQTRVQVRSQTKITSVAAPSTSGTRTTGGHLAVRPKEPNFAIPKTKQTAVRPKQPAKIAPAPSSAGNLGNSQPNRTLLTHLLTGGKYDPNSGIIIPNTTQSVINKTSSPVNTVLMQSVKPDIKATLSPPTVTSVTAFTGSSLLLATSSPGNLFGSTTVVAVPSQSSITGVSSLEKPVFTIGASPDKAESSKNNSFLDDKKNFGNVGISAEQKRRVNIKSGFDTLHDLIPSLSSNPSSKISKAAMLQKAVEYIQKLKADKCQSQKEMDILNKEISSLNAAISESQSQLPASGVPVTRQRYDQMRDVFDDYVRERTQQNWKFWIFSIIIRPLFESYNGTVSTSNTEELYRTVLSWLDRHCSLLALRPTVLSSLTMLSRITSILSDPTQVPQQAVQAVTKKAPDK